MVILLEGLIPSGVIHTVFVTGSLARQSSVSCCPNVPITWLEHDLRSVSVISIIYYCC